MSKLLSKEVSVTELFYDLVIVYALSRITEIFAAIEEGHFSPVQIILYILCFFAILSSWNIQMVYFNRFGQHTFKDIISMTSLQMPLYLGMSVLIDSEMIQHLPLFSLLYGSLSLVLTAQYLILLRKERSEEEIATIKAFSSIMATRTLLIYLSAFFEVRIALLLLLIATIGFLLFPLLVPPIRLPDIHVPLHMDHLSERLNLLTIIMLGELLVGDAQYFSPSMFNPAVLLSYLTVVQIYMFNTVQYDHLIEQKQISLHASLMIYFHYLIWIGINLFTVSIDFLFDFNRGLHYSLLILSLFLFYTGVLLQSPYNKNTHRMNPKTLTQLILCFVLGSLLSFFVTSNVTAYWLVLFLMTLGMCAIIIRFKFAQDRLMEQK